MNVRTACTFALFAGGLVSGCTDYYKVTDPQTRTVYYTDQLQRQQSGAIMFKDARTSAEVTLPASAVERIPKEQYDVGKNTGMPGVTTAPS